MDALSLRRDDVRFESGNGCFFVSVFGFIDSSIYTPFLRVEVWNLYNISFLSITSGPAFNHALSETLEVFEIHARRFLRHTALDAILWLSIARTKITLTTLE